MVAIEVTVVEVEIVVVEGGGGVVVEFLTH